APPPHRPRVARCVVLYAGVCGPSLAVFVHREPFADPHAVRNGRPSALVRPCRSQAAGIRLRKGKRAASRTDAALLLTKKLEVLRRGVTRMPCPSKTLGVELTGLEPVTPTLPVWCATSCATAPCWCPYRTARRFPRCRRGPENALAVGPPAGGCP